MSAPIGPGDWVICEPPAGYRGDIRKEAVAISGPYPKPGGVYCVRECGPFVSPRGVIPGLRLVGIVASIPGHPDCWWNAEAFKPIYRRDEGLIQRLLQPIPAEPEQVTA